MGVHLKNPFPRSPTVATVNLAAPPATAHVNATGKESCDRCKGCRHCPDTGSNLTGKRLRHAFFHEGEVQNGQCDHSLLTNGIGDQKRREVVTPVTVNMPTRGEKSKKERFDARLDVWQHFQHSNHPTKTLGTFQRAKVQEQIDQEKTRA